MTRLIIFVSAALWLTGSSNLVLAQRGGGGHASGGGHAFGGGHSSAGHIGSASHTGSSGTRANFGALSRGIYPVTTTPYGINGINPGALTAGPLRPGRGYGNGSGRYGFGGYGHPYRNGFYGGGFYPYFPLFDDYDDYNSFDDGGYQNGGYSISADANAQTGAANENLLGDEVNRLSAEVEALREQQSVGPMPSQRLNRVPYNAPPMMPEDQTPSTAPVTLILRDGKKLELQSYAVMGNQVWDFGVQPAKKIAISTINVEASEKATEAAGGDFPQLALQ